MVYAAMVALGFRGKLLASYLLLVVVAAGVSLLVLDQVLGRELEATLDRRLEGGWWRRPSGYGSPAGRDRLAIKLAKVQCPGRRRFRGHPDSRREGATGA